MKVTMTLDLTPSAVLSQAASGYWYNEPSYKTGRVRGKWPRLTKARLTAGVARLATWPHACVVGRIIIGRADGSDMDVLLQLSLFEGLIYG